MSTPSDQSDRSDLPAAATDSRDRAIGALLGLAVGDAVGTTLEFKGPGSFEPISDLVGGGPFGLEAGQWTDDTSMALCLAESILDRGDLDPADQLRRYVRWHRHGYLSSTGSCFDIGGTTVQALSRFERSGATTDATADDEAAANGSLMRLAAVPIRWHRSVAEAAERSGESSRTTHPAARPVDTCRVMGAMIAALIVGASAEQVLASDFWTFGPLHPEVDAVARASWQQKEPPAIRGRGYCVDALEAALWAVGGAADLRDAVLRAANLGDDADTTAAIAGQLAGARWGASAIPAAWREKLTAAERIASLAEGLYRAGDPAADPGATPAWSHDEFFHAWWVAPGLLAGEYPGHPSSSRAGQKVDLAVDAGVRTFIDLTTPEDHLAPYEQHVTAAAEARDLDLRRMSFPIPDLSVAADEYYDGIVDAITAAGARGAVYVHCWGGVGRTGTVVGCVLADQGLADDAITDRLRERRRGTRKATRPCPENACQRDLITRRVRRRAG